MPTAFRLSAGLIVVIAALCATADAALVAHWTMEEGPGNADTFDSVNFTNDPINGTENTDFAWETSSLPGVPSGSTAALDFSLGDSHVESAGYAGIGGGSNRTVAFWIRLPPGTEHNSAAVAWGDSDNNGAKWHVRMNPNAGNGQLGAIRTEIQGTFFISNTDLRDGQWHHVASVYEDTGEFTTSMTHYIDGVPDGVSGTGNTGVTVNTDIGSGASSNVQLGGRVQGGQSSMEGALDDVRIYDTALTQAEVQALVPEASTLLLAALGLTVMGLYTRRRPARC